MLPRTRVRLVDVPVSLFRASEQHTNDLLREVALIGVARPDLDDEHLFGELLAAADTYAYRPAAVRQRLAESVAAAQRAGSDRVTVDIDADPSTADGALAWEELLQRFDALSRAERLLTLPADGDVAAYRAWYVTEVVEQVRTGRDPVPWQPVRSLATAGAAH